MLQQWTILTSLLLALPASAQTPFSKAYGGLGIEDAYDPVTLPDGGFMIVGSTNDGAGGGDYDTYVVRTDADGNVLWANAFGLGGRDMGMAGVATNDGGMVVAGHTKSWSPNKPITYLMRVLPNGQPVWMRTYGELSEFEALPRALATTTDGGYIIVGEGANPLTDGWWTYVIRTGNIGDTLWTGFYDLGYGMDVAALPQGGALITGTEGVAAVDVNGEVVWARRSGAGSFRAVNTTSDGSAYLAGLSQANVAPALHVARISAAGDTLWTERYEEIYPTTALAAVADDEGCVLAGTGAGFPSRTFAMRLEPGGDIVWGKRFQALSEYDQVRGVCFAPNGDIVTGGYTANFAALQTEVHLVRTADNGSGCNALALNTTRRPSGLTWTPSGVDRIRAYCRVTDRQFDVVAVGGTTEVCSGVSVAHGPPIADISLSYHPGDQSLRIHGDRPSGALYLHTALGQRIELTARITGEQAYPLPRLTAGTYLAELQTAQQRITIRFVYAD